MSIKITIDLANSPHVVLEREKALDLFKCLSEETGGSRDLEESMRIVESFDEFYRVLKKKFEEYITPQKDQREVILGKAIVHKLRLFEENSEKFVEIIFDRRFDVEYVKKCLSEMGFSNVIVEKQML